MKVIVKARHMNLTPALKAHAEDKLGNKLMRIFDRPAAKIEIELADLGNVSNGTKECRATVHMPRGNPIIISEVHDDMYSAINLAHDRLLEQVKRERGRRRVTGRARKASEKERAEVTRQNLTADPEQWEKEVKEFEGSDQT